MPKCLYQYPDSYPVYAEIIISAIFAIYCPVIIILNVVLIISLFATKQSMRNTSNLLIVCSSISDCLIGAVVMPMIVTETFLLHSSSLCTHIEISMALKIFFGGVSSGFTMLLAADRYFHMNPEFQRSQSKIAKLFKRPRIYVLIFACLVFFAAITLSFFFTTRLNPQIAFYFAGSYLVIMVVMLATFVAIYTRTYFRIRRFVAQNPIYQDSGESGSNQSPEYLKALFKTVLLLVVATALSWLPTIAMNISSTVLSFVNHAYINTTKYLMLGKVADAMFFSSSFVNAFIILYRNEKSKKWLKKFFSSRCRQVNEQEEARSNAVTIGRNTNA